MIPLIFVTTCFLLVALFLAPLLKYKTTKNVSSFHLTSMFEKRSALPATIVFFLTLCYGGLITFLALHAATQGIEGIGAFFTAYAIAVALSRPLLGKFVDRKGYGVIIIPGLIAIALSLVLLSFAHSLMMLIVVALLYGAGFAACNSTLQTMAVADVPYERRGAANATYLVGFDSGIGFGAVLSSLVVSIAGYTGMYAWFSLIPLLAGVLFISLARGRKPPALQEITKEK